ncbi:hypothetical protein M569_12513 [Genlisea aurea]|uniref:Uncharacterized protein n=1 Tax=Genlisea aurea TaxID=192259 RepID=S8DHG8_9LAMI|nr:hypothetical protein M569_12513 [Genlisea aurea]
MTYQLNLFSDLCGDNACSITMPNGRRENAHQTGTDRKTKDLIGIGNPVGRVYRLCLLKTPMHF